MLTSDANPSFPAVEPISRVTAIPLTGRPSLLGVATTSSSLQVLTSRQGTTV